MFSHPFGLIVLAAVPVVVALHLYRRRFEPRSVSGLFLWRVDAAAPVSGPKREPLRTSASFWCELLAVTLLALAFAGPHSGCVATHSEHLVVVLDSSASMAAVVDGVSARERALLLVRARIADLGRGSRVTLVASGPRAALIAGPGAFPAEADARLADWRPCAPTHDLAPAVALALQFAGEGRVLLVSDHFRPEDWPETLEVVSIGRPLDNWAITHAARTRERDEDGLEHERVFVTVSSFASSARERGVRVSTEGRLLAEKHQTLAPDERVHLAFTLPEGSGPVEVRLDSDGLTLDDVARLAPPPARTLALYSALDATELRRLGLAGGAQADNEAGSEDGIARWLELVPHSVHAPSPDLAHLVLAHAPAEGPNAWSIVLAPLGSERTDLVGPFLANRAHPALAGLTLEGSVWSIDPALELPGVPLVSAGNRVLLSEEARGGRVVWRLDLDPERSSLQRSPDWPILLSNLAEERRAALPGPERTNLVVGETFVDRPGGELVGVDRSKPVSYRVEGPLGEPDSEAHEVPALAQVVVEGLERPGFYRLSFADRTVAEFALNFTDARESELREALPGRRAASVDAAREESELSWLELALLLGALALALADWSVLARLGDLAANPGSTSA